MALTAGLEKILENNVKNIAMARKSEEMIGNSVEEFDEMLNELCTKWHNEFASMDKKEFSKFLLKDLLESLSLIGGEDE